nr:CRISPR-associated endonuclease Cas1 [Enhydrobacter aerosaccus]
MRDIVIDQKGCQLTYDRQLLILHHPSFNRPVTLPFSQIQSITLVSSVVLNSTLLTKLADCRIAVVILPSGALGQACFIQGRWQAGVTRRQKQYETLSDDSQKQYWARQLIRLKIHRQVQLLQRINLLQSNDGLATAVHEAIAQLNATKFRLKQNDSDNLASLRGIEGATSAVFFRQYQAFFEPTLGFNNRNRRPPLDPVNTILSLGYTLLQGIYEEAVYAVGFDPYLGVLHEVAYGRASLACDFVELQRGEIEYWVWQLFHQQILTMTDFSVNPSAQRPCELLKSGRNRFYQAFSKIKPILRKTAFRHVWLWQKRLTKDAPLPSVELMMLGDFDDREN